MRSTKIEQPQLNSSSSSSSFKEMAASDYDPRRGGSQHRCATKEQHQQQQQQQQQQQRPGGLATMPERGDLFSSSQTHSRNHHHHHQTRPVIVQFRRAANHRQGQLGSATRASDTSSANDSFFMDASNSQRHKTTLTTSSNARQGSNNKTNNNNSYKNNNNRRSVKANNTKGSGSHYSSAIAGLLKLNQLKLSDSFEARRGPSGTHQIRAKRGAMYQGDHHQHQQNQHHHQQVAYSHAQNNYTHMYGGGGGVDVGAHLDLHAPNNPIHHEQHHLHLQQQQQQQQQHHHHLFYSAPMHQCLDSAQVAAPQHFMAGQQPPPPLVHYHQAGAYPHCPAFGAMHFEQPPHQLVSDELYSRTSLIAELQHDEASEQVQLLHDQAQAYSRSPLMSSNNANSLLESDGAASRPLMANNHASVDWPQSSDQSQTLVRAETTTTIAPKDELPESVASLNERATVCSQLVDREAPLIVYENINDDKPSSDLMLLGEQHHQEPRQSLRSMTNDDNTNTSKQHELANLSSASFGSFHNNNNNHYPQHSSPSSAANLNLLSSNSAGSTIYSQSMSLSTSHQHRQTPIADHGHHHHHHHHQHHHLELSAASSSNGLFDVREPRRRCRRRRRRGMADQEEEEEQEEEDEEEDEEEEEEEVGLEEEEVESELEELKVCEWENCGNTFMDMEEFVQHLSERHVNQEPREKNRYFCLWANCKRNAQEFNARYKLLIHMRVHSGEKPYACEAPTCRKSFSRLENLKIHKRSHTGEKPYKCAHSDCTKSFTNSSDRIKHHKTHKDPKPYTCAHKGCTKRYTDPSSLRKHLRAHKRSSCSSLHSLGHSQSQHRASQAKVATTSVISSPHQSLGGGGGSNACQTIVHYQYEMDMLPGSVVVRPPPTDGGAPAMVSADYDPLTLLDDSLNFDQPYQEVYAQEEQQQQVYTTLEGSPTTDLCPENYQDQSLARLQAPSYNNYNHHHQHFSRSWCAGSGSLQASRVANFAPSTIGNNSNENNINEDSQQPARLGGDRFSWQQSAPKSSASSLVSNGSVQISFQAASRQGRQHRPLAAPTSHGVRGQHATLMRSMPPPSTSWLAPAPSSGLTTAATSTTTSNHGHWNYHFQ